MSIPILDSTYDALAWGSHLPTLFGAIGASRGPVLELGVGHFSTPALHAYCGAAGRQLISVDDNVEWLTLFKDKYQTSEHGFIHGSYDDIVPNLCQREWGVAFIDNSAPGSSAGARRAKDFALLVPHSDFVVVHDAQVEAENYQAIRPLLVDTDGSHLCTAYFPHTLIVSQRKPIPASVLRLCHYVSPS